MRAVLISILLLASACTELEHASPDGASGDGGEMDGGVDGSDHDARSTEDEPDATRPPLDGGADGEMPPDAMQQAPDAEVDGEMPIDTYTLDDFCADIVAAMCVWRRADSPDASDPCANVEEVLGAICDGPFQNAVASGRVAFDAEMAEACVAAYAVVDGEPVNEDDPSSDPEGPCTRVAQGQVEEGEDCYIAAVFAGSECAGGYCPWDGTCPSTCRAWGEVGDECDGQVVHCDAALYCRQDIGECAAYGELDDPCGEYQECVWEDFYCKDAKCTPREVDGTACTSHEQCASYNCAWLNAEQSQGLCATRQGEGGECQVDGGCLYPLMCVLGECAYLSDDGACFTHANCPPEERCMYEDGTYRCDVPLAENATCTFDGPDCGDDLWCTTIDNATYSCMRVGVDGDACSASRTCENDLWCQYFAETPTCEVRGAQGASCDPRVWNACLEDLQCVWSGTCEGFGRASGASCHPEKEGACGAGLFCDRQTRTCVENRGADGVCNNFTDSGCTAAYYCACTNEPCSWDVSETEPDARCVAKLPDNAVCNEGHECQSGYCNGTCQEAISVPDALACNGL